MGKLKRKQVPQPPRWFDYDTDNCYFCHNKNNCNGCKILKEYRKKKEPIIEKE